MRLTFPVLRLHMVTMHQDLGAILRTLEEIVMEELEDHHIILAPRETNLLSVQLCRPRRAVVEHSTAVLSVPVLSVPSDQRMEMPREEFG